MKRLSRMTLEEFNISRKAQKKVRQQKSFLGEFKNDRYTLGSVGDETGHWNDERISLSKKKRFITIFID